MNLTAAPSSADRDSPARVRRRWLRRTLELLLLAAALYLATDLLADVGWRELESELRSAAPPLVALIYGLLVLRYLAWNARWQGALHRVGIHRCFWRGAFAILAAAAVNHLTPSFRVFGGLLRARYVSRARSRPFPETYGTVLFDQIANQTVTGVMSVIAFVTMALRLERAGQAIAAGLLALSLVLLIPLLLRKLRRRQPPAEGADQGDSVAGFARRLRPLLERGKDALRKVEDLIHDPSLVARAVLLSLLYVALNLAAAWTAFLALGHQMPIGPVFLATSLGVTIGAISGTPGGSLTTEAAMVTCYGLLGIDRQTALAATLLYRGLHYLVVLTLGVPSLVTVEFLHRRAAAQTTLAPSEE